MDKIFLVTITRYTYASGVETKNFVFDNEDNAKKAFDAAKKAIIEHDDDKGFEDMEYDDYDGFFQRYIPFVDADEISVQLTEKNESSINEITDFITEVL